MKDTVWSTKQEKTALALKDTIVWREEVTSAQSFHTRQCCNRLREALGTAWGAGGRVSRKGFVQLSLGGWIGFQSGGLRPGKEQRRQQGGAKRHLKEELEKPH